MPRAPSSKPDSAPDRAQRPASRFSHRDKLRILEATWHHERMRAHPDRVPAGTVPSERQVPHEKERLERETARLRLKLEHPENLLILTMEDGQDDGGVRTPRRAPAGAQPGVDGPSRELRPRTAHRAEGARGGMDQPARDGIHEQRPAGRGSKDQ